MFKQHKLNDANNASQNANRRPPIKRDSGSSKSITDNLNLSARDEEGVFADPGHNAVHGFNFPVSEVQKP